MSQELAIQDMTVSWRHLLDLGRLGAPDLDAKREIERALAERGLVPPSDPLFAMLGKVFRTVCSLGSRRSLFLPLHGVEAAVLPGADTLKSEEVLARAPSLAWHKLDLTLLLHQSGIAVVKYATRFERPGPTTQDAVQAVRLGIKPLALRAPARYWGESPRGAPPAWVRVVEARPEGCLAVATLRDFSAHVLRDYLRRSLGPDLLGAAFGPVRLAKCTSSTFIELHRTDPACESVSEMARTDRFGRHLRGIGAMDLAYHTRADQVVEASLQENLSQDEELGLFLLGLSDLAVFNRRLDDVARAEQERLGLPSAWHGARYVSYHYDCLLDWLYLERFLIEMYDVLLTRSMSRRSITPREMLELQKGSMQDLIEYTEGVTPFATRADFLERARTLYRIKEEQERLEKKRDLVMDYVMQEYSLRTNRGIQLLNVFVSATVAFQLMQLVIQIRDSQAPGRWSSITLAVFALLLGAFYLFYRRAVAR